MSVFLGSGLNRRASRPGSGRQGPGRALRHARSGRLLNLEGAEVRRRNLAVAAGFELVRDLLAFAEGRQARALDGGDVDERVLAAVIRLDEAEALGGVEEFHGAIGG